MLGKYRFVDKIATGGMAEVYLARSTAAMGLGKFVAIKKILPSFSSQPDFVEMFKMEARIAMQLQHRNLVSIHDFGMEDGQCYLVMELIMGLSLRQILQSLYRSQKIMPVPVALYIAAEAAAGLHYAHDITIHRDVSPQNLMVGFHGDVKVIDFGVAKAQFNDECTQAGILKGKLGYMSPEQLHGEKVDCRSDVYSLGVVLYEILAQRRPYKGKTESDIVNAMKNDEIPWLQELNPAIDSDLAQLVHQTLRIEPSDRFGNMDVLERELRNYLSHHYPHFSIADVSQFMKREFATEQQAFQEKLFGFTPAAMVLKKQTPPPQPELTDTVPAVAVEKPVVKVETPEIPEPVIAAEEPPAEPSFSSVRTQRVLRKKFHIKYAHQSDPHLNSLYEMNSMHGQTKRGELC